MTMRMLFQLLVLPLPWLLRRPLLGLIPGFTIARSARIGLSVIGADRAELGEGAVVGHLTLVKGLSFLELGPSARLGNLNWVTAVRRGAGGSFAHLPDRTPSLVIAAEGAVTHRHLIDCTGGVSVGHHATVAGWHSQIISHSFDFRESRQDAAAIEIGAHAFVGSRAILLKGSALPERSILGAGSVLDTHETQPLGLYRGNLAKRVGELPADLGYFLRESGYIE